MKHTQFHQSTVPGLIAAAVALLTVGALFANGSVSADLMTSDKCRDTDGRNYYLQSKTTMNGIESIDTCNPSGKLIEYFCKNDATESTIITCPVNFSCVKGACVRSAFFPQDDSVVVSSASSASSVSSFVSCTDTDAKDPKTKGTVTKYGRLTTQQTDRCISARAVREYYCGGGVAKFIVSVCPKGTSCKDGACVK